MPRKNFRPKTSRTPFELTCHTKRKFRDQAAAEKSAELASLHDPHLELGVYHCPHCGSWHLTSRAPKQR